MGKHDRARTVDDLPLSYNAAADLIDSNLMAGRGDKTAIIDIHGRTSFGTLAERVHRMASALAQAGIRREQRILLCLTDTVDFPTVFLGAIRSGVVPIPLNTLLTARDYRWMVEDSGAVAVFVSGELQDRWTDIAADHPEIRFFSSGSGPWTDLEEILAAADPRGADADTHRDDIAFWLYTSGSTGNPKGAMHTHASLRLTANLYGRGIAGYREDDVVLSIAKQFFAFGLGNALTFPLASGATVVLHNGRATPDAISALMRTHGVSFLAGVPTFFAGWLASEGLPAKEEVPNLRLAISAGEALPAHLARAFREHFGVDILDGLGSTEMLHTFLSQRAGEVRDGCTGRPVSGYEVRIINDAGEPAKPGEIGELQVKGPTMAAGYWRNRPKTLQTFLGEWLRTGDKYICDADGWYTHAGRTDDMLKVGGIYVSPVEVEQVLGGHPAVLEAVVVGARDADDLVKPRAHVVLMPGIEPSRALEDELKQYVKGMLAPYKYPRWIVFTDELPKTASGKIQRFKLRDG